MECLVFFLVALEAMVKGGVFALCWTLKLHTFCHAKYHNFVVFFHLDAFYCNVNSSKHSQLSVFPHFVCLANGWKRNARNRNKSILSVRYNNIIGNLAPRARRCVSELSLAERSYCVLLSAHSLIHCRDITTATAAFNFIELSYIEPFPPAFFLFYELHRFMGFAYNL